MSSLLNKRLTERQTQVLDFLKSYQRKYHKPPTFKEIGEALNLKSSNAVFKQINALVQKGYIKRDKGLARGLYIPDDAANGSGDIPALPVLKNVYSDEPTSLKRHQKFMHVDTELLRKTTEDACVIMRADDDGMAKSGIFRNDFLLIERTQDRALLQGEIGVVVMGDKTLVRLLKFEENNVYLNSPDRGYKNDWFALNSNRGLVVGKLIGIMRRLD